MCGWREKKRTLHTRNVIAGCESQPRVWGLGVIIVHETAIFDAIFAALERKQILIIQ